MSEIKMENLINYLKEYAFDITFITSVAIIIIMSISLVLLQIQINDCLEATKQLAGYHYLKAG